MAEPARTRPPAASAADRDALVATKLRLPRPQRGFVVRPRLLERLAEGSRHQLTLVCAPAGFGKTSLLADWAHHSPLPVAWLSLDPGDNDPIRFWRYVAEALDQVRAGIGRPAAALLQGPPSSLEAVVTAVVNELASQVDPVALVLDDYHLIEGGPVHGALAALLERQPEQLRLVIATRVDPPLPLARLRARGQLAELRAAELRFNRHEATDLLREATGVELPAGSAAALAARTEGWVAGLQLAGLSLRDHADPAGFVASFSGSHRYVLDYLTEEVLARQPEPLVRFMLEISVLERLSGPLCDAVTGRNDSQQLLEQIERANLFLVPLDEVRSWWRFHQLFADLLQARLRQQPDRVPGLHRAAAAWCEAHWLADEAFRHALGAGDPAWAARLVERHADEVLLRSEGTTLQQWLAALPEELVGSRLRLLLAKSLMALLNGRGEEVETLLDAAERAFAQATGQAEELYEPSVGRAASVMANVPASVAVQRAILAELRGDAEATVAFASRALAELGEGEWMLQSQARVQLGMAEWLRGRPEQAERIFTACIASWRAAGEHHLAAWGCDRLGLMQRAQGRLGAAVTTYQQALVLASASDHRSVLPAAVASVGMAEVAYQRGELDDALRHAMEGVGLARQLANTQWLATGLAVQAWIWQAQGQPAAASDAIDEAERVAPGPGVISLANPIPAQRVRLALAQGRVGDAAGWVRNRGLGIDDQLSYPHEPEYLVLARVLLANDRAEEARELLGRLHALAIAQQRTASVIEIQALRALALHAAGDRRGALAALAEALALAAPEGWLRVFVDEGTPMAALLRKLAMAATRGQSPAAPRPAGPYLDRLLHAFELAGLPVLPPPRRGGAAPGGLVLPLSGRELEVLQLLAAGSSNRAIAEELVVTVDTVKSHVTHILDKLGVANRTQAVVRARELGLLT
jgi:LuxR family transcriptional regulator, maltose regulon positive regulatory protein